MGRLAPYGRSGGRGGRHRQVLRSACSVLGRRARRHALDQLDQLELVENTGLAVTGAPAEARARVGQELASGMQELQRLRWTAMDPVTEWRLLLGRCLSFELCFIYELHDRSLLPKRACIELRCSLFQQLDGLRHDCPLPEFILYEPHIARIVKPLRRIGNRVFSKLLPGTLSYFLFIAWDFEEAWGCM